MLGGAKVLGLEQMRKGAAHVGFATDEYRRVGALGLLAGRGDRRRVRRPGIGVLAACGLLVLLGGALARTAVPGTGLPRWHPLSWLRLRLWPCAAALVAA